MLRLMLLRHAKTERDAPTGNDRDRRLDERGHRDAAAMAQWMAENGYAPDLALVSTATRAHQTWNVLAHAMPKTRVELIDELYHADTSDLLRIIRMAEASAPRSLMIVAHNPSLHELALTLPVRGDKAGLRALADNLPTMGLAVIDFAVEDWTDISFRSGTLTLFQSPKLLRETFASDTD
jgi:phosphohistidine phosphatase